MMWVLCNVRNNTMIGGGIGVLSLIVTLGLNANFW